MTRDTKCTIDNAARTAILLVDGRLDCSKVASWSASLADKVVLFDASALVSIFADQFTEKVRDSTWHHFRMLLNHFIDDDGHERLRETLAHIIDGHGRRPAEMPHLLLGDRDQPKPYCETGVIERALVWGEPDLTSPVSLWSALDRRPVRGAAARCRYLFLAQTGAEDDRRGYVVLVQSARRSDNELYRTWGQHRAPAVLKFEPHVYCQGSFATRTELQSRRPARELLMCVVPLDPIVDDVDADFSVDRLAGLLCHRSSPVAEAADEHQPADVAGSHEAWLSLTTYSDLFLGDGERKRVLDAHLTNGAGPRRKAQADPGLA